MKLGLLCFCALGSDDAAMALALRRRQAAVADRLNQGNHVVVPAESPAATGPAAASEAARLVRADCDGIVLCLFAGEGAAPPGIVPDLAASVALRAGGVPVLLLGDDLPGLLSAAGALAAIGITAGRAFGVVEDEALWTRVQFWADLHAPDARKRGQDAAGQLFGRRYAYLGDPLSLSGGDALGEPDAARWLTQFGVSVLGAVPAGRLAERLVDEICADHAIAFCCLGSAADAPVAAPAFSAVAVPGACGADGALTAQLLALIAGQERPTVLTGRVEAATAQNNGAPHHLTLRVVSSGVPSALPPPAGACTFARLGRRSGRYICIVFVADVVWDADLSARVEGSGGVTGRALFDTLTGPYLHAVPGDHRAAVKAACEALDVEPILIEPILLP